MSVKNFKITTGLDLDGLVLNVGAGNALYWNNDALATQAYVTNALSGVDTDLSDNAGSYLDWNAGTSQFDVDIFGVAGALVSDGGSNSAYLVNVLNTTMLDVNISALVTELTGNQHLATQSYVGNQGFLTSVDLNGYATESYVGSQGFLTSVDLNGYATESYVTTALGDYTPTSGLDTAIAGYGYAKTADLPAAYTDEDAVNAINTALVSGGGIEYVANTGFQVDTSIIATKAYVDATAQGLDVKASVKVATTSSLVSGGTGGPVGGGTIPWLTTPGVEDPTIDGVTLSIGDRVLLKNEFDGSNGIYEVTSPTANYYMLERTADGIINDTLTKGAFVFVESGTNAGKGFVAQIYSGGPMGGGDNVFWSQFSESGSFITSVDTSQGFLVNGGQLLLDYGSGLAVVNGHLGVNEQRHVTVDDEYNWRSVKVARRGLWNSGSQTAVVTIPASSQWAEMVVHMGPRISKLMVALDEWSEYAIVDRENSSPEATIDVFYDSPNGNFIITGYNTTGFHMTVVADFII